MTSRTWLCLAYLVVLTTSSVVATAPPEGGSDWPAAFQERLRLNPTFFTYQQAFIRLVQRVQENRIAWANRDPNELASPTLPTVIKGRKAIPVLPVKFSDTKVDPFDPPRLQQQLFGSWPTETMSQLYKRMSSGALDVTGTVHPWKTLSHDGSFYAGPDVRPKESCYGVCSHSKVPEMVREALTSHAGIDWSKFDNDGPDDVPNSADDDGYVDFVAIVQPNFGGECRAQPGNRNIWSHRSALKNAGGQEFVTQSFWTNPTTGAKRFIKINDYVIVPSLACDAKTMIQIGVFAHEFGHAWGLPDLYALDGQWQGVGHWCLMGYGSWGGDGKSPDKPVQLSAWAKSMLGWLQPTLIGADRQSVTLNDVSTSATAIKIPIPRSPNQYYLLENRERSLADPSLPASGLLIWRIDDSVIFPGGLASNSVNAAVIRKGVAVIEASGQELDLPITKGGNRGDPGDVFPGSGNKRTFDEASTPTTAFRIAVCSISDSGRTMTFSIRVSTSRCAPANPSPLSSSAGQATPGSRTRGTPARGGGDVPPVVTLGEIAKNPQDFEGRTLTIQGVVENRGTNYFRDRRLVVTDNRGTDLRVGTTKIPFETPPGSLESADKPPETVATLLGKSARLVGRIRRDPARPGAFVFDLESATVTAPR
jgi:M6 family metalloprotease-like protein